MGGRDSFGASLSRCFSRDRLGRPTEHWSHHRSSFPKGGEERRCWKGRSCRFGSIEHEDRACFNQNYKPTQIKDLRLVPLSVSERIPFFVFFFRSKTDRYRPSSFFRCLRSSPGAEVHDGFRIWGVYMVCFMGNMCRKFTMLTRLLRIDMEHGKVAFIFQLISASLAFRPSTPTLRDTPRYYGQAWHTASVPPSATSVEAPIRWPPADHPREQYVGMSFLAPGVFGVKRKKARSRQTTKRVKHGQTERDAPGIGYFVHVILGIAIGTATWLKSVRPHSVRHRRRDSAVHFRAMSRLSSDHPKPPVRTASYGS